MRFIITSLYNWNKDNIMSVKFKANHLEDRDWKRTRFWLVRIRYEIFKYIDYFQGNLIINQLFSWKNGTWIFL